jgi:hypothetical protein
MNNVNDYVINEFIRAVHDGTASSNSSTGSPAGNIQASTENDDKWAIDKTYEQLYVMNLKKQLTGLAWHRSEDSIVIVPLTFTGKVDGQDAFVFSTIITDQSSSTFHSFIVKKDDSLTYITEDVGVETSFEVAELTEEEPIHPDVESPSTKIIYLTKDPESVDPDHYKEWIYTNDGDWVIIGDTSLDLSGYYTSTQVDELLGDKVDKVEGKGLSTNDYTDAEQTKLENLPDNESLEQALSEKSDVGHTHTKSDITDFAHNHDDRYYTETEIDTALGEKADKSEMSVVAGTGSDSDKTTITLKDGTSATVLTEHQDISGKADKATTLAGYGITDAYTKTETDTELGKKVDVVEGKGLSTNDYTDADKTKLEGVESGAQVNVIESLSVDGVAVEPDANKNVDIHIPTLPVATAPDQLFTSTSGDPEWQQLEKSTWGTELTDTQGNVLEDENGNSVMDENAVDLWTKFNDVGFGAERAAADIDGNSIIDTYATKSEVSGAIADAHTHDNKAILDATEAPYTTAEQGKLENLPTRDELTVELNEKADKIADAVENNFVSFDGTGNIKDSNIPATTSAEGTSSLIVTNVVNGNNTATTYSWGGWEQKSVHIPPVPKRYLGIAYLGYSEGITIIPSHVIGKNYIRFSDYPDLKSFDWKYQCNDWNDITITNTPEILDLWKNNHDFTIETLFNTHNSNDWIGIGWGTPGYSGGGLLYSNPYWTTPFMISFAPGSVYIFRNGSRVQTLSTSVYSGNAWHHVAITYTATTGVCTIYMDGNSIGTYTITGTHETCSNFTGSFGDCVTQFAVYDYVAYTENFTVPTIPHIYNDEYALKS